MWEWLGCLLGIVLLFAPLSATAQNNEPESSDILEMNEMVVTASKSPKSPGNVTQKVRVIDNKQINEMVTGKNNLAELLTWEPGIFASVLSRNDANWGSSGGLGGNYNTYMLDGLPVDSFMDPQALPFNAIERIEIQRGPASVLYPNYMAMDFGGNQSPLTGTTNIILKDRFDHPMTQAEIYYGSYNTFGGKVYHQQGSDNLSILFGADYESSDYTNYGTDDSWLNMIDDPEYEKTKLFLKTTLFLGDSDDHKLSLFVNRANHKGDVGRPNRDFDHTYWTVNAAYDLPINDNISAAFKVGLRDYERTYEEDNYPTDLSLASQEGVDQQIIPADISFSFRHLNDALLTIGTDFQAVSYETWSESGTRTVGNDADAYQYGLYIQEELPVSDFILRSGLRYSYTRHEIDLLSGVAPGIDSQSWDELLWSVGARYNFSRSLSAYANVGTSFTAPSLKSVGGTISESDLGVAGQDGQLPNRDLEPETGTGFDLGMDFNPTDTIKLGIRGFYNIVDDQIVTVVVSNTPSQTRDINAGDTTAYGFELSFTHSPLPWLNWFANYTYTNSEISNDTDPDQDGNEVSFVPEHMGNIGTTLYLPMEIQCSIYLHLAGEIYDSTSTSGRTKFSGYELLNASIKKKIKLGKSYNAEVYLDLYNLTDNHFKMPWQFQDPGISGIGGLRITF